jgi:uncharacterized protein YegP (UPF0339 family)
MSLRMPRSGAGPGRGIAGSVKVIVFRSKDRDYRWSLRADNGEVIADSGESYRRRSYAIKKAKELFPNAELIIEDGSH